MTSRKNRFPTDDICIRRGNSAHGGFQCRHFRQFQHTSEFTMLLLLLLLLLLLKKGRQCKAGRERLMPYQPEDPSPTTPTHRRKEEKGKTVEDTKGSEQRGQTSYQYPLHLSMHATASIF